MRTPISRKATFAAVVLDLDNALLVAPGAHPAAEDRVVMSDGSQDVAFTIRARATSGAQSGMFRDAFLPTRPGARDLLEMIDLPVAVISADGRGAAMTRIRQSGLAQLYSRLFSQDDFTQPPPDPECHLIAAHHLRKDPSQCLCFAGTESWAQSAIEAGMFVVRIADDPACRSCAHTVTSDIIAGARQAGLIL